VVQGNGAIVRLTGEDPANPPGTAAQLTVGVAQGARGSLIVTGGGRIEMDTTSLPGPGDPNVVTGSRLRVGTAFGLPPGNLGSVGSATITGPGSQVDIQTAVVAGGVQVGRDRSTGDLSVLDGASITMSGPAPVFIVGRDPESRGTVNVGPGASIVLTDTTTGGSGRISRDPGSFGTVTVDGAGALLQVPGILTLGLRNNNVPPATADQGGSAVLTVANGGTVRVNPDGSGILRLGSGDILKGNGVIDANVESFGGVILPGLSPGPLEVKGNYVGGPGSQLVLEVSGAGQDTFRVEGLSRFSRAHRSAS
jgi:T5SS/PEP-CTERM-associated repeat protein